MTTRFVKDPDSVESFYIIWCSEDNTNDGTANDGGELQGETITTTTWTVPTGITKDSDNKSSATIRGITYSANTITAIVLSSGTDGTNYDLVNEIVTSGGRTLNHTITIMCRNT